MTRKEAIRFLAEEAAQNCEERDHLPANVDYYMEEVISDVQEVASELVDSGQVSLIGDD